MLDKNKTQITRKDALNKMGKYAALTALGIMVILNPLKARSASLPNPGEILLIKRRIKLK